MNTDDVDGFGVFYLFNNFLLFFWVLFSCTAEEKPYKEKKRGENAEENKENSLK